MCFGELFCKEMCFGSTGNGQLQSFTCFHFYFTFQDCQGRDYICTVGFHNKRYLTLKKQREGRSETIELIVFTSLTLLNQ